MGRYDKLVEEILNTGYTNFKDVLPKVADAIVEMDERIEAVEKAVKDMKKA